MALAPIIVKCFEEPVQSTEDAIATALHATMSHLEQRGSYVRMLLLDFSSAFNTIVPNSLVEKLQPPESQSRTPSLLSSKPQHRLIPLLYTLYTHDCTPTHPENAIIKFADDKTIVGLISINQFII